MNRASILMVAVLTVVGLTWIWHTPLGAADRLAATLEESARAQLDRDEMVRVQARVVRDPLTRRVVLSGPADDFQRREIKRRLETLPGIGEAVWDPNSLEAEDAG